MKHGCMCRSKRQTGLFMGMLAGLLAAWTGLCADPAAETAASAPAVTAESMAVGQAAGYPVQRMSYLTKASDMIDTEVTDLAGHKLGKLEDFVVDWNRGRVYCALVRPEHLYGASNYYVAIPAKCFLSADDSGAVVNTNLTTLIGFPRFIHSGWDAAGVSASLATAYRRFNQPVFWDEKKGLEALGEFGNLTGREVDNRDRVDIGKLADLVLDLPAERVMLAVVSFYGSEENLHAVPLSALEVTPDKLKLVLNVTDLKVAELVNPDGFLGVEFTDPDWVAYNYRAYGKEPVLDREAAARLSAVRPDAIANVENPPLVASQPGLARNDGELAQAVLMAFVEADMANATLAAKVKVTAAAGRVTLAGQVPSEAAKGTLEKISTGVVGAGNVKDELTVQ